MSELNDFFAKKDRRRKKPSKAGKSSSSSDSGLQGPEYPSNVDNSGSNITNFSGNPQAQPTKTSKGDDGWIDIEDPKTARVNTGGKTIEEFKRDHDDKEQNGNEDTPSEKFTGWAKTAESDSTGGKNCVQIFTLAVFRTLSIHVAMNVERALMFLVLKLPTVFHFMSYLARIFERGRSNTCGCISVTSGHCGCTRSPCYARPSR